MTVKENPKNRTYFVYDKSGGIESFISTPFRGAKKATRLTIRDQNGEELNLDGRQVRTLRAVLAKAEELSLY